MKNAVRWGVLLVVVGLAAAPGVGRGAAPDGVSSDNVFPHFRSNISQAAMADLTRNEDQTTLGRTRGRMYFNVIASDDLRGVFGFELDALGVQSGGDRSSFDRNTDMTGNIKTKWLYVDFRMPQVPIGNRTRLGGMPL